MTKLLNAGGVTAVFRPADWCICIYDPGKSHWRGDPYRIAVSGKDCGNGTVEVIGYVARDQQSRIKPSDWRAIKDAARQAGYLAVCFTRRRRDGSCRVRTVRLD